MQTSNSWLAYAGWDFKAGLPKGPAPLRPPSSQDELTGGDSAVGCSLAQ
ncbi:MAG TPA: hypothetical protein VN455_12265 [Methanotrichaceae archaeon]|nr:hypothetical protein [Methanotrichaceae archaeon]